MFQFIGHIQRLPILENNAENRCVRCTGVFLYRSVTPGVWEKTIEAKTSEPSETSEDNDGM